MAEVEGEKCCLCFTEVYSRSIKSKRIRLDRDAAKKSRDVLDSLSLRYFGLSFSKATTSKALFCHKCRAKAEGLAALAEKIQCVEKDLASAIGVVLEKAQPGPSKRSLPGSSVSVGTPSRKRQKNNEEISSSGLEETNGVAIQPQEKADTNVVSVSYAVLLC
uniref:ZAD domain-containing protein n=1 Tax=Amphimedon queenslandica TaxID=400682 RepID=A0A1X7TIS7_AMPQE